MNQPDEQTINYYNTNNKIRAKQQQKQRLKFTYFSI